MSKIIDSNEKVVWKKIRLIDHFDLDGNPISIMTCENCGNQIRRKDWYLSLGFYDRTVKCCSNPSYYNGVVFEVVEE